MIFVNTIKSAFFGAQNTDKSVLPKVDVSSNLRKKVNLKKDINNNLSH